MVLNFLMFLVLDSFMGCRVPLFQLSVMFFDVELSNDKCFRFQLLLSSIFHSKTHGFSDSVPFGCSGVGASGTVDLKVCRWYWFRMTVSTVSTRLWPLPRSERWRTCCEPALRTERPRRLRWVHMARRLCLVMYFSDSWKS